MASNIDWRTFGGVRKYEKNSITGFNSLIVDKFTVKDAYNGVFTVSGELIIYGDTQLNNNLSVGEDATISGNAEIGGDVGIDGNVRVSQNIGIDGNTDVSGNTRIGGSIDISGNIRSDGSLSVKGALNLSNDVTIGKDLYVNNKFYLGNNINSNNRVFFSTVDKKLGINIYNPTATLDISSGEVNILKMKTTASENVNILSIDGTDEGVTVSTDGAKNAIKFWNETKIPFSGEGGSGGGSSLDNTTILGDSTEDASITYHRGGNITVSCSNNTFINSNVSIGKETNGQHWMNETVVISDVSHNSYLHDYFETPQSAYQTGNALTLLSTLDNSSNIGLNLVTSSLKGISINGGTYIKDITRSFGAVSLLDVCGASVPVQMTVAGNNKAYLKSTTGFNTLIPKTENYSVCINGPIRVTNDEIQAVLDVSFEVTTLISTINSTPSRCILVGSPSGFGDGSVTEPDFNHPILYSNDGGKSWGDSSIINKNSYNFTGGCIFDNTYSFLSGEAGGYYISPDSNQSWVKINIVIDQQYTGVTDVTVFEYSSSPQRYALLFSYDSSAISWFVVNDLSNINVAPNESSSIRMTTTDLGSTITPSRSIKIKCIGSVKASDNQTYVYIAGDVIRKFLVNPSLSTDIASLTNGDSLFSRNEGAFIDVMYAPPAGVFYNAMCVSPTLAVFVGDGMISYDNTVSVMEGPTATFHHSNDTTIAGVNFQDVKISQSGYVIAVGEGGKIYYSFDRCVSWSSILPDYYGMASVLTAADRPLSCVAVSDLNSVIIGSVYSRYHVNNTLGRSKLFYCHWPDLFNHANNNVADICGNMNITGYLNVKNDVNVNSGNIHVSGGGLFVNGATLMNGDVSMNSKLKVRSDVVMKANLNVEGNLDVAANLIVHRSLVIEQPQIFQNTTESTDISDGAIACKGGVGIAKNLNVGGNSNVAINSTVGGNLNVGNNLDVNGIVVVRDVLYANSALESTGSNSGGLRVKGGMGVVGNVFMGNSLSVNGRVSAGNDNEESEYSSTSVDTGALVVNGGAGISGNLFLGNSATINGNLSVNGGRQSAGIDSGSLVVTGGLGVSANTYVGGNLVVQSTVDDENKYAFEVVGAANIRGNLTAQKQVFVKSTQPSTSYNEGAIIVEGGVGVEGSIYSNGRIVSTVNSGTVDESTAGIRASNSGAWISGNIFGRSNLDINGNITLNDTLYFTKLNTINYVKFNNSNMQYNSGGNHLFNNNVGIKNTSPNYELDVTGRGRISEQLYVTGNIGVGTETPEYKLDVNGTINATGAVTTTGGITATGTVTAGTSTPNTDFKLYVEGNAKINGKLTTGTGGIDALTQNITTSGTISATGTGSVTAGGGITANGTVTAGTSTPNTDFKLYVEGNAKINGSLTTTEVINAGSSNIVTTGSIGVGTASPNYGLDALGKIFRCGVVGDNEFIVGQPRESYPSTLLGNSQNSGLAIYWDITTGAGDTTFLNKSQGAGGGFPGYGGFRFDTINSTSNNRVTIFTARDDRVCTNTNMGIKNDNPSYTLDVTGNARVSTKLLVNSYHNGTTLNEAGLGQFSNKPIGTAPLHVGGSLSDIDNFSSLSLNAMRIRGNKSTYSAITITGTSSDFNAQSLILAGGGDYPGGCGIVQAKDLYRNGGTPLLLNPDGGNVGIGNTSPSYKLDVNGSANISGVLTAGSVVTNLIRNPNFDTPVVDSNSYLETASTALSPWRAQITDGWIHIHRGVNVAFNYPPPAHVGAGVVQHISFQHRASISQTVTVSSLSKHRLRFYYAARQYSNVYFNPLTVSINDVEITTILTGATYWKEFVTDYNPTDFSLTIKFETKVNDELDKNICFTCVKFYSTINEGAAINGSLTIQEVGGGTEATGTTGSLVLKHSTTGVSSIVFPSATNVGSDYGYIKYLDNHTDGINERSRLVIGVENDAGDNGYSDSIILYPCLGNGNVGINTYEPAYTLDVNGSARITGGITTGTLTTNGDAKIGSITCDRANLLLNPNFTVPVETNSSQCVNYTGANLNLLVWRPTYGGFGGPIMAHYDAGFAFASPFSISGVYQAMVLQFTASISQTVTLVDRNPCQLKFYYTYRTNASLFNPMTVKIDGTTYATISTPPTGWTEYTINYTPATTGDKIIKFETTSDQDYSIILTNIRFYSSRYDLNVNGAVNIPGGTVYNKNNLLLNPDFTAPTTSNYAQYTYMTDVSKSIFKWTGTNLASLSLYNGSDYTFASPFSITDVNQALVLIGASSISQTVYLVDKASCQLNFYYTLLSNAGFSLSPINVSINGAIVATITSATTSWTEYTINYTPATTGDKLIKFETNSTGSKGIVLTNIRFYSSYHKLNVDGDVNVTGTINSTQLTATGDITTTGNLKANVALSVIHNNTGNSRETNAGIYCYNYGATNTNHSIITARTNGDGGNPYLSLDVAYVGGWSIGIDNRDSHKLKFVSEWDFSSAQTKVTILRNGNVGIGTTSPSYTLDVNGDARITGTLTTGTGGINAGSETITTSGTISATGSSGAVTAGGGITAGGTVTAGTTTPNTTYKLYVNGTANINGRLTITETGGGTDAQSDKVGIYPAGSLILEHSTAGASSILFRSSIEPAGDWAYIKYMDSKLGSGSESGRMVIGVENNPDSGIVEDYIILYSCGGAGRVGVNTYSPTKTLDVSGECKATSFYSSSDYRLKESIIDLKETTCTVDKLRPIMYELKDTKKTDIGFLAHEVQEEFPFLVSGEKDGKEMQSLNYTGLIGLLVKEIQFLKAEREKQHDLISSMMKRLELLESRIN